MAQRLCRIQTIDGCGSSEAVRADIEPEQKVVLEGRGFRPIFLVNFGNRRTGIISFIVGHMRSSHYPEQWEADMLSY